MKKIMGLFVIGLAAVFGALLLGRASSTVPSGGILRLEDMFSEAEQSISAALKDADSQKVKEMFDFMEEKAADGALSTEEGLSAAIAEGEERFGVTIDRDGAKQVAEVMEKLEDMGFSGEDMIDRAKGLYEEYGAGFMEHMKEELAEAAQQAAVDAAGGFWDNLISTVKELPRTITGK